MADDLTTQEAVSAAVRWLEDEYRETRTRFSRMQHQLDQVAANVLELGDRLRTAGDEGEVLNQRLGRLASVEDQLRQLAVAMARLETHRDEDGTRLAAFERAAEEWRQQERGSRAETWQRLEVLARAEKEFRGHLQSLDEARERQQQQLTELRQRPADGAQERVQGRLAQQDEMLKRHGQDLGRLEREQEPLRQQDQATANRVDILVERLRHLEEENAAYVAGERWKEELLEQIELARSDIRREAGRITETTIDLKGLAQVFDGIRQQLAQVEARFTALEERVNAVHQDLHEFRERQLQHQAQDIEVQERQRRRQMAELEEQLRELRRQAKALEES